MRGLNALFAKQFGLELTPRERAQIRLDRGLISREIRPGGLPGLITATLRDRFPFRQATGPLLGLPELPDALRECEPGDQSGQLNSHIVLLLLRQIQSLQGSVREQADMIRDSIENSSRFQAELIAQLQQLKSSLGASAQAPNSSSSPDSPSASDVVAKTTSTRVSDMKVDRRVAQALGRIIPPTAEEEENRIRNLLVDRVHRHVLALLRCNDTSNLAERFPPLGDDNVASYKNGDGKIVCSPMNFRVDFHHPWKSFEFNVEARVILIETFLAKARGGAFAADPIPSRLLTKEVISRLIDQYIITLRRAYRAQVKPPSKEQADKAKRLAARTSRQGTLYRNRRFVVIRFSSLSRHRILFDRLSANNMSGDETDGEKVEHAPVYRIILAEWQSDDLRAFLWALDAMYIKYWEKPPESRRTKGNAPRTRPRCPTRFPLVCHFRSVCEPCCQSEGERYFRPLTSLSSTRSLERWEAVPLAPPDSIFKLTAAYKADTHPNKVNLGVGAYRDDDNKPWATEILLNDPTLDHEYLPITGLPEYTAAAARLVFGKDSSVITDERVASVQTISGTGANHLGALFLSKFYGWNEKLETSDWTARDTSESQDSDESEDASEESSE
ncbi:hypothetical protein NUW54_g1405 [Trametes sanguinea]|uniref:Uncharacterized protein n=1 Tax=Trametes sanguinea TaxID=158606 RepID=A0ACC1Q7R8_9APHY|nr:hypothetical protein NUW54_g1405 [Trametes sanguinea]